MSKMNSLPEQTGGDRLTASKSTKSIRADRKAWKNKLKRKHRRH